jgi:hypothetical protein
MFVAATGFSQYSVSEGAALVATKTPKMSAENIVDARRILFSFNFASNFYNLFFTNVLKSMIFFEFFAAGFFHNASRMSFAAS